MVGNIVDLQSKINTADDRAVLEKLATKVRDALQKTEKAWRLTLGAGMDAGDALIEAETEVHTRGGKWNKWLKDNCFICKSTAELYQQLARNRDQIEAAVKDGTVTSIRAARALIKKPSFDEGVSAAHVETGADDTANRHAHHGGDGDHHGADQGVADGGGGDHGGGGGDHGGDRGDDVEHEHRDNVHTVGNDQEISDTLLRLIPIERILAVRGGELRALLPVNPLLKLREMDDAALATAIREAVGRSRAKAVAQRLLRPAKTITAEPAGTDAAGIRHFARAERANRSRH